jgi:hypothetical protein
MLERLHEYLKDKLDYPAEAKDTEYKSAVKFDEQTDFAAKLVKHVLGFANSGGGLIIIGFRERPDKSHEPDPAITDEITASYEVTRLCQHVEKYLIGQDRIKITIYKESSSKGVIYPIISIGRFPEYPFICTKDYVSPTSEEVILESGQIYIRTEGARTLTVKAISEWRQLIRECIKASQEIEAKRPTEGIEEEGAKVAEIAWEVEKPPSIEKEPAVLAKEEKVEKQFFAWVKNENNNAMTEMQSAGFTKGFFKFIIQVPYGLDQIDNNTLLETARKSECHNTGWPIGVVMTKPEYKPLPLADGIRAVINTGDEFDYWAINNRGHFFFLRSHQEDAAYSRQSATGNRFLWFDIAIWRISEIISYTSNLCAELKLKQGDKIKLTLSYEGLTDRELKVADPNRMPFTHPRKCTEDKYEKDLELQVADIMPKLKDHVYQIAIGLFVLFDFYTPERPIVDSIIDKFLNARL